MERGGGAEGREEEDGDLLGAGRESTIAVFQVLIISLLASRFFSLSLDFADL
jgi:hypothetical protein